MIIGIVGSEGAKFTKSGESKAKTAIREILTAPNVTGVSSGHCHLGGIDIWAEEIGKELGLELYIYPPKNLYWNTGYRPRNIQIATKSDVVYCITVDKLPDNFGGMKFDFCYHCNTKNHVKSGGCWTTKYAQQLGKPGLWRVIDNA